MGALTLSNVFLAMLIASQAPAAKPVSEHIDAGEASLENLEYGEATQELMLALSDPRATEAELLRANLLAGIANRVLERNVEARLNFHYVLSRAPQTQLPPNTSPKIASFFQLVRREVEAGKPAAPVEVSTPPEPAPAAPLTPPVESSAVPPADDEPTWVNRRLILGLGVLGASAFIGALLVTLAGASEIVVATAGTAWTEKALFLLIGRVSLGALVIPAAGAVVGSTIAVWGLVE